VDCLNDKMGDKPKAFIATYFKDYKSALMHAAKQNVIKRRGTFEVITNGQGYFVVSKNVIKKVFGGK